MAWDGRDGHVTARAYGAVMELIEGTGLVVAGLANNGWYLYESTGHGSGGVLSGLAAIAAVYLYWWGSQ